VGADGHQTPEPLFVSAKLTRRRLLLGWTISSTGSEAAAKQRTARPTSAAGPPPPSRDRRSCRRLRSPLLRPEAQGAC
jgi:hypothetical protein